MELHGKSIVGEATFAEGPRTFKAVNPATGIQIEPAFTAATEADANRAMEAAQQAFETYRWTTGEQRARFLERIADEIEALGDALLERFVQETALAPPRATGERARTVGQLRLFAEVARDGSWMDARIDTAIGDRKPLPKPDLRRVLIPMGPVAIFSASNFPLAFSVAGGDTASALAAGCPVVVKCHQAHPGVSEMVGSAVQKAATRTGIPDRVFSMLQCVGHEVGLVLVRHPATAAVGFTGSLRGGRALFDAAVARPRPIPVYAEMGSTNPVFILPSAAEQRAPEIATGLVESVTLGVGQFCTKPGLAVGLGGTELDALMEKTAAMIESSEPGTMLYDGLSEAYDLSVQRLQNTRGVNVLSRASGPADTTLTRGAGIVFRTDAATFLEKQDLAEEVFGPATMFIEARSKDELEKIARHLDGQLTATIHGTEEDLAEYQSLVALLENRVGRLIFNGFPTGLEICSALHHGGPYPATTDAHFTSVGTAAIYRFARPICYQNFPQSALPSALRDKNELNIWRLVNNKLTQGDLG